MSPTEDNFLSSSSDKTVRLWNLNSPNAVAQLNLPTKIVVGNNLKFQSQTYITNL